MLDDALRRRLEALNRGALSKSGHGTPATPSAPASLADASERKRNGTAAGIGKLIPGILQRGHVVSTAAGEHLRIRLPIDALWPRGGQLVAARQTQLQQILAEARHAIEPTAVIEAEWAALVAALPDRLVVLDLETCGLGGAALFLAGVLRQIDGEPAVELLLARNYSEEHAVLESLWQILANHDVLLTFNGKSFDWPMVRDRSVRYRLAAASSEPRLLHLDVLHYARRRWRRQLPDCRLQTLERFVCRRIRAGDIPGQRIPAAYAEFVRTGFEREMDAILYHNAMDLVTLLDLALRLAA
jgi:uncharacterized protein